MIATRMALSAALLSLPCSLSSNALGRLAQDEAMLELKKGGQAELERFIAETRASYEEIFSEDARIARKALDHFTGCRAAAKIVALALKHPHLDVRAHAAGLLKDLNDFAVLGELIECLERHNVESRGGSEVQNPLRRLKEVLIAGIGALTEQDVSGVDPSSSEQVAGIIANAKAYLEKVRPRSGNVK